MLKMFVKMLMVCVIIFTVSGCSLIKKSDDYVQVSYDSLLTLSEAYHFTMTIAGQLYQAKYLNDDDKNKIITIAMKFDTYYDKVVDGLKIYVSTSNTLLKSDIDLNLSNLSKILSELREVVNIGRNLKHKGVLR